MRLVIASDIHYGNRSSLEGSGSFTTLDHRDFAAKIHAEKPDVLLVTGDCSEGVLGDVSLESFFDVYKNPHGDSICIPGNHDVWLSDLDVAARVTSEGKYKRFIKLAKKHGWTALVDTPYQKNDVWIAGNMCWYDFSHIDKDVNKTPLDYEREKGWADYDYMNLMYAAASETPMIDFCLKRMAEFKSCLKEVPQDRKALVVASHFVGFPRLLSFYRDRDYCQTFMANIHIGELACTYNADLFCCGHNHRHKEFTLGNMRCINNGSGYGLGSKRYDILNIF